MESRQLLRTDLPKKRLTGNSLHIPVLLNNKKRYICDINFADDTLCWLENAKGIPTKISKLQLITDERSAESIRLQITRLEKVSEKIQQELRTNSTKLGKLRFQLDKILKGKMLKGLN